MCYYSSLRRSRDEVANYVAILELEFANNLPEIGPRYKVGPKQNVVILRRNENDSPVLELSEFGIIPLGQRERPRSLLANARAESIESKWPWKLIYRSHRALGIIDGFFDPEKVAMSKEKAPWSYYQVRDGQPFFVAALATEFYDSKISKKITSTAFLTVVANSAMRIHNRMPAILDRDDAKAWLTDQDAPLQVLQPYPAKDMSAWRVHDSVKSNRTTDGPGMIEPVEHSNRDSLF